MTNQQFLNFNDVNIREKTAKRSIPTDIVATAIDNVLQLNLAGGLQNVLSADAVLTQENTIDAGGFNLIINANSQAFPGLEVRNSQQDWIRTRMMNQGLYVYGDSTNWDSPTSYLTHGLLGFSDPIGYANYSTQGFSIYHTTPQLSVQTPSQFGTHDLHYNISSNSSSFGMSRYIAQGRFMYFSIEFGDGGDASGFKGINYQENDNNVTTDIFRLDMEGHIRMHLPVYADNAAAMAGLPTECLYRQPNGSINVTAPDNVPDKAQFPLGLANYASNAAALSGGMFVNQLYRNGDNVCIVH